MQRARMDESGAVVAPTEAELDLGGLVRGIARHKWWIIGATIAGFVLAAVAVSVVSPRYTSEAKVFLESQHDYFTRPDKAAPEQAQPLDPEAVQSQVQLVTSRDLARQAIRKLGLVGNPEFDPLANGMSPLTRVLVLFGLQRDPRAMSAEDRALDAYYERLTVYPVARTRVLQIEFVSRDPELAARGANTIAELYLDLQAAAAKDTAKHARDWLGPNIEALQAKVADAEGKVAAFRARSGLLIGSNNTTITAQQLAELNTQLANARSAQAEAQAKAHLIRELIHQGRVGEISDVANNELIRNISQQRVTLRAQLALESRTLLPGHPRIQELTAQLANVDSALREAAEKVERTLENDAKVAGARVEALSASLDAQKNTVATGNDAEVQLHALERDAAAARDQLESFLQKYREATARDTGNLATPDARIISRAVAPELPSFPKKVPTIVIGTLAGLLLSLGIVVSRELLLGRPYVTVDREAPLPAMAPRDVPVFAPPVAHEPADDWHEAEPGTGELSDLLEHIVAHKPTTQAACVLVCGIDRGSGATAAAIALARMLASDGRAIIVDFDQEGPGLDRFVADAEPAGLAELVAGQGSFTDAIHRDRGSRLHMLPAGRRSAGEPADAERLNLIVDALVATYDYIVLDGAPLADSDASLDLSAWTDVTVLVTDRDRHDLDTRVAVDTLVDAGAVDVQIVAPASRAEVAAALTSAA
jgi:succinoglycan biosynthesis transport protein ExoP